MACLRNRIKLIKKNFGKKPRIAITGLNPHCESNFKNSEEDSIITPAIISLQNKKFFLLHHMYSRQYDIL